MNTAVFCGVIFGLLTFVERGYSQFFYTVSTFPQSNVINHGYQYSTPNAFFSRSFFPGQSYYFSQQNNFQPQAPGPSEAVTEPPSIDQRQSSSPVEVRTNIIPGPTEFRGFAYHTTYDDGGSSNVVFVTGPESAQIRSLYPNDLTQRARTLASDLTDANAAKDDEQAPVNSFPPIIRSFFENPSATIQNFYARNNELFTTNSQQDNLKYPASTVPLQKAIPLEAFSVSNGTANTTAAPATTTTAEEEVAESIIVENSRILPNVVSTDAPKRIATEPTIFVATNKSDETTDDLKQITTEPTVLVTTNKSNQATDVQTTNHMSNNNTEAENNIIETTTYIDASTTVSSS